MRKVDYPFLYMYLNDCRLNLAKASSKLSRSPQQLSYALQKMHDDGILNGCYTLFDYSLFGEMLFKIYFKGGHSSESQFHDIIESLKKNYYVIAIYDIGGGNYDFLIEIMAKNPARFSAELNEITKRFPELCNYDIIINVDTHFFMRKYKKKEPRALKKNQNSKDLIRKEIRSENSIYEDIMIGGDKEKIEFTQKEIEVMEELYLDPTISYTAIAKNTGYNIKTIIDIINDLTERKVILAHIGIPNLSKTEIVRNRIMLGLHNDNSDDEKKLLEFCRAKGEIVQVNRTIGIWDIEIDVETYSIDDFRNIYLYIREEFKDMINQFNSYQFFDFKMRNYLPRGFFNKEITSKGQNKKN